MRVRILSFRYSSTLGGFDDGPLQEFLRDKEVISFKEHFYVVNDVPHLSCVVAYQQPALPSVPQAAPARTQPALELDEAERFLFDRLREWCSKTARDEGVPPYVIFNNRQLAEVARRRPENATALSNVPGVGAAEVTPRPGDPRGAPRPATRAPGCRGGPGVTAPLDRPSPREAPPELQVLAKWEAFADWLLDATSRWPKNARFTLTQRVENHVLDVLEILVESRYDPGKRQGGLARANLLLERLRYLFRRAKGRGVQSARAFERAMEGLDETGRMIHGWRKSTGGRP